MAELIWEGKYDKDGKKTAPLRVALPFQTVETVNESAQDRQKSLELFRSGRETEWRNRLIWGDKKYVLPSLLPEFAGKVNLIYIDPPFDTGADFSFQVEIDGENFTKEPSVIEMKAYRDTWGRGLDSYLQWFYETVVLLRELLHETGSIYVHLDHNIGHYAKAVLDEVFGIENFQREIVWRIGWISGYKSAAKNWIRNHDVILFYVKSKDSFTFNKEYIPYPPDYRRRGEEGPPVEGKGYPIEDVWNANPFEFALEGSESLDSIQIKSFSMEKTGFPTQKNEALLKRIIKASSNPGDLVLDCFVGSGTTAAVAEKLGRRWIACDLSRFAIHTTRKRLLSIPNVKPFVIQNLGKYERQVWQAAEFGEEAEAKVQAYRRFILELYHAQPITGYTWLHGLKAGRMVHVGAVDSPVSPGDIAQIAAEFKKAVGTGKDAPTVNGVDVLGWDFAFELNEVAKQQAAQANIQMRFLKIPRDVMDKRAIEQGDIQFFELAALSVDVQTSERKVTLKLTDFVIPPDEVPEEVQKAITHWQQWIDYWAVDWNNNGDTFHNEWQDYRTRKKRDLQMQVSHTYAEPGEYTIVVKVIDILGNDTTKTLQVKIQ
jgi:adenine-specific DNA-methyltransferase